MAGEAVHLFRVRFDMHNQVERVSVRDRESESESESSRSQRAKACVLLFPNLTRSFTESYQVPTSKERVEFIAEQPAPAPHLARPEGRAALTHMC